MVLTLQMILALEPSGGHGSGHRLASRSKRDKSQEFTGACRGGRETAQGPSPLLRSARAGHPRDSPALGHILSGDLCGGPEHPTPLCCLFQGFAIPLPRPPLPGHQRNRSFSQLIDEKRNRLRHEEIPMPDPRIADTQPWIGPPEGLLQGSGCGNLALPSVLSCPHRSAGLWSFQGLGHSNHHPVSR